MLLFRWPEAPYRQTRKPPLAPCLVPEALGPCHRDLIPTPGASDLDEAVHDLGVLARRGEPATPIAERGGPVGKVEAMPILDEAIADGLGNGPGIGVRSSNVEGLRFGILGSRRCRLGLGARAVPLASGEDRILGRASRSALRARGGIRGRLRDIRSSPCSILRSVFGLIVSGHDPLPARVSRSRRTRRRPPSSPGPSTALPCQEAEPLRDPSQSPQVSEIPSAPRLELSPRG